MSNKESEIAGIKLSQIKDKAGQKRKAHKKMSKALKRKPPKQLDSIINKKHHELFQSIDCLECANCCKTTSPLILQSDITSIAAYLKLSAGAFMEEYVIMDEDGDFVFNSTPCPFLGSDNRCNIYDSRPKACQEYPHTQQRKQIQIVDITLKNIEICPAVFRIFEHLEEII